MTPASAVDLRRVQHPDADPHALRALAAIASRLGRGEEQVGDVREACALLRRLGDAEQAEFLLRRNQATPEDEAAYTAWFGTTVADAFEAAVDTFAAAFGVDLEHVATWAFLDEEHRSTPTAADVGRYEPLRRPCRVRFSASHPSTRFRALVTAEDAPAPVAWDLRDNVTLIWTAQPDAPSAWWLTDWRNG